VHPVIVAAGFAFPGAKKTSQRISRTDRQIFTKDILGQGHVPLKSYDSHHVSKRGSASSTNTVYSLNSMGANVGPRILS
jgi:hypothetical protein